MREIELNVLRKTKNYKKYVALVDDEDFDWLNQFKWCITSHGYAGKGFGYESIYMHTMIIKAPKGMMTDHINRNRLDNQRINLRIVTRSQNRINSKDIMGQINERD